MTNEPTTKQKLAEVLLGEPLAEYVREKRSSTPRWSWRLIADQITKDTRGAVTVSGQILRVWFGDGAAQMPGTAERSAPPDIEEEARAELGAA